MTVSASFHLRPVLPSKSEACHRLGLPPIGLAMLQWRALLSTDRPHLCGRLVLSSSATELIKPLIIPILHVVKRTPPLFPSDTGRSYPTPAFSFPLFPSPHLPAIASFIYTIQSTIKAYSRILENNSLPNFQNCRAISTKLDTRPILQLPCH